MYFGVKISVNPVILVQNWKDYVHTITRRSRSSPTQAWKCVTLFSFLCFGDLKTDDTVLNKITGREISHPTVALTSLTPHKKLAYRKRHANEMCNTMQ